MKSFEIPMFVTSLLGLCFLSAVDAPTARAEFAFGEPVNLGPTINGAGLAWSSPSLSADGLELYLCRQEPGAQADIFVARRATADGEWGVPVNLGPPVNSASNEWTPSISADGLSLYFTQRGTPNNRVYVTRRATTHDNWGTAVNIGGAMSTERAYSPCISADDLELYFVSLRADGYGGDDLSVSTRATVNDEWGAPVNLGPTINSPTLDADPAISPDGLLLFFSSRRSGGSGSDDLYVARRATRKDPWGPPMNLGPIINGTSAEFGPKVSFDGSMLYFAADRPGSYGSYDIWRVPIIPTVNFNGDGKVDARDMALLVDNWGKSSSLCDIGPFPWGDGVVDERDLRVLMESLTTPGPRAADVPCDVILSWISPSFAQTCDVYLGTSVEAVNSASRTNPQNVLVSQGQTATTYDPLGSLEFSKTYYWRVDFVISSPAPAIYQGPVLKFTTEPFAHPIKNIIATASSAQSGMGSERTVDGSGLDGSNGHSTDRNAMWLSTAVPPHWIQYEFDQVYALQEMWVWNSNQTIEPYMGFGAKSVKIEYSTDGTAWTPLEGVPEFARAPGKPGYMADTKISFGGISAKHVRLTIEKAWGTVPSVGLSEVQFFYIPD